MSSESADVIFMPKPAGNVIKQRQQVINTSSKHRMKSYLTDEICQKNKDQPFFPVVCHPVL